jgi:hypothetical protein
MTPRIFTLTLLVCPLVHGCVEASGGAVEVSWSLRDISGATTTCDDARVEEMHLYWQVDNRTRDDVWSCTDGRGVTGFDLEPGSVSLWLEPECANGPALAGSYRAPPVIVRTITEGDVITLETQLIEVRAADCSDDCTCP